MKTLRLFPLEFGRLLRSRLTWLVMLLTVLGPVAGLYLYQPAESTMNSLYLANPAIAGGIIGGILFGLLSIFELDRTCRSRADVLIDTAVFPQTAALTRLLALLAAAVLTTVLTMLVWLPVSMGLIGVVFDLVDLHIQPCDSGWDYTLYDAASMKELDGGQLDMPELSRMKAVLQICDDNDLGRDSVKYAPLSMIETLQEAAYQQMQAEVSQMAASSQLPEAQEQALDEYPMPDEQVSTPDMQEYGYSYDGMFPVTRERALELDAAGLTVYVLHEDNTESMVFDSQEIMDHGGIFGVDREEWEKSPQFHEKVMERQEHQQEREQAFLAQNRDCFAIYQVSRDDPQNVRFMNLDWLKSHDISIDRSNYDLIYTAPLRESGTVPEQLEKLYEQFNLQKPADFHSPSMSVSDIVAIKQDGKVSCHYCDSVGFTQISGFLPENPLKNAEMAVEDDYGMIDGIINNGAKEPTVAELEQQARSGQSISLMDLAAAAHREEREKKKSVMEQLKSQPKAEHKKIAPKKSAEREI